jgi:hypothetical protein
MLLKTGAELATGEEQGQESVVLSIWFAIQQSAVYCIDIWNTRSSSELWYNSKHDGQRKCGKVSQLHNSVKTE